MEITASKVWRPYCVAANHPNSCGLTSSTACTPAGMDPRLSVTPPDPPVRLVDCRVGGFAAAVGAGGDLGVAPLCSAADSGAATSSPPETDREEGVAADEGPVSRSGGRVPALPLYGRAPEPASVAVRRRSEREAAMRSAVLAIRPIAMVEASASDAAAAASNARTRADPLSVPFTGLCHVPDAPAYAARCTTVSHRTCTCTPSSVAKPGRDSGVMTAGSAPPSLSSRSTRREDPPRKKLATAEAGSS